MTRFVLYLVLSCCFEIAFQIPSTENFRYVAKASDRSSCPSVFRFRGGYGGDGWKAGEQDDGLLNFEDEEDSKERRMYEEDDLDNPDLDRETFGGDLDSGETDDAWENMLFAESGLPAKRVHVGGRTGLRYSAEMEPLPS
eukprot:754452-Hanusia_phi.AAC.16